MSWSGSALLFCPADRPERFVKAAERSDVVILDLEDAVAADSKEVARGALAEVPLAPERTIVRINGTDTPHFQRDLEALSRTAYSTVMLPKAQSRSEVEALSGFDVVALCESATGILRVAEIAASENLSGIMLGAEDLMVSLGGRQSRRLDGPLRDVVRTARSAVLLAAAAAGVPAIDSVFLDLQDEAGLAAECNDAAGSGFAAKACIHPAQVAVVRQAFQPSPEEVTWARRVVQAAKNQAGAFLLDGAMVDAPVLLQAERVVARAATYARPA